VRRTIDVEHRIDLVATLRPLRRGRHDPCMALAPGVVWRATRTPDGAAVVHVEHTRPHRIVAEAWGPGASWALDHAPQLVGAHDDPTPLAELLGTVDTPERATVERLHRRAPGLRLPSTLAVAETLVPVILEQRVTGQEARRSYRRLVLRHGERAPTPAGAPELWLPPDAATLAGLPSWEYHRLGVERQRADTIVRVSRLADRLNAAVAGPGFDGDLGRLLAPIPGVGAWTIAETALTAVGDADAVSVGDYHLPNHVAWLFRGVARSDDATMLDLLEPYRGQRGRVVRLVMSSRTKPPAFGPKQRILDMRHM